MKKKSVVLLAVAILFLGGCQGVENAVNSHENAEVSVASGKEEGDVLTDRQRALLLEIGILDEESSLTKRKISAIKAIDDMLT